MNYSALVSVELLVCAGSASADSLHRQLAHVAEAALIAAGATATFVEIGVYDLPLYNQDTEQESGIPSAAAELRRMLSSHDGLALASPEYNVFFPAPQEYDRPGFSAAAGRAQFQRLQGQSCGADEHDARAWRRGEGFRHLRDLLGWLGMSVIERQLALPRSSQVFNAKGGLARADDVAELSAWASQLVQAAQPKQHV